jgi:hypothetical protein
LTRVHLAVRLLSKTFGRSSFGDAPGDEDP